MSTILPTARKMIPRRLFLGAQPLYHYFLALAGALVYRFPSRHIKVVGITGTKGKTSTAELVNAVLEETGLKTALCGTLRFKVGDKSEPNLYKMTMPGRFFMQKFLRRAVDSKCDWAILEMTSEGAKQFRHKFIELDALIFTNLAPEHIESHGSYQKYLEAKLKLAQSLENSSKQNKVIVANADDKESGKFLSVKVEKHLPFSLKDAKNYSVTDSGVMFTWNGQKIASPLRGLFNIYNILAAATFGQSQGVPREKIGSAIAKVKEIKGRAEEIKAGQKFGVYVDYAHTPDSLEAFYQAFEGKKKICILGNTGGGRDKWKRPKMAKIADSYCDEIILTNEDPYDEDPQIIVKEMAAGMSSHKPKIIMDRREAIRDAFRLASLAEGDNQNTVVLITGKGTDPYMMGPNGTKIPWSDAQVAKEELLRLAELKI